MSIQHRPDRPKPWRARYYGPDQRERSQSFRRKVDAQRWLATQTADVARGQWFDAARGRTPVADLAERWYRTTVDLRPSTRVRIRGVLDNYVLPQWGRHDVAGVEHLAVREWARSCRPTATPRGLYVRCSTRSPRSRRPRSMPA